MGVGGREEAWERRKRGGGEREAKKGRVLLCRRERRRSLGRGGKANREERG